MMADESDDWRPKVTTIEDPLVDGTLGYRAADGSIRRYRVTVGKITPFPSGHYCAVQIEGLLDVPRPVMGNAPLDTLLNAMSLVRDYDRFLHGEGERPRVE
jgi:hypothetical protein